MEILPRQYFAWCPCILDLPCVKQYHIAQSHWHKVQKTGVLQIFTKSVSKKINMIVIINNTDDEIEKCWKL